MIERLTEILTLPKLIAWLETQDPATKYDYVDICDCLVARYVKAQGFKVRSVDPYAIWIPTAVGVPVAVAYPEELNEVALDRDKSQKRTYGDALERAKESLS